MTQPGGNPMLNPNKPVGNPMLNPGGNPMTQPGGNPMLNPNKPVGNPMLNPGGNPMTQPGGNPMLNPNKPVGNPMLNPGGNPMTQPGGNPMLNPNKPVGNPMLNPGGPSTMVAGRAPGANPMLQPGGPPIVTNANPKPQGGSLLDSIRGGKPVDAINPPITPQVNVNPVQYQEVQSSPQQNTNHEYIPITKHESVVPKITTKDLLLNSKEYLFNKYAANAKNYLNNLLELKEDAALLIRNQKPLMNALLEIYDFAQQEMDIAEANNDGIIYTNLEGFINIVEICMLNNNYFIYNPEGDFDSRTMMVTNIIPTDKQELNMKIVKIEKCGIIYMKNGQKVVIRVPKVHAYRYQAKQE
jgi:hypothetical protein